MLACVDSLNLRVPLTQTSRSAVCIYQTLLWSVKMRKGARFLNANGYADARWHAHTHTLHVHHYSKARARCTLDIKSLSLYLTAARPS
jgi:hypothetical protein